LKNNYGFSNDYFREKSYYNKREINDKLAVKGNGLDVLGIYLSLYMEIWMKEQEKVQNMEMIKECMMRKGSKGLRFSFIDEPYLIRNSY